MNGIDALLTGGQLLAVNAAAADRVIDGALYYGPGLVLAATGAAAWAGIRWAIGWRRDRAIRREYAARAYRLCRVADHADALLAMPTDLVNARLEAQLNTLTDHAREEEK
ncbi:hypothetical protein [Streptomyces drozdowiczii]|uniref:hypothetical protein n=1 Tax=Streptomyces drozdowiczii TaxID=202862 RepID=UPI00403C254D